MRYVIRVSSVLWNCSFQGRFILLHDPYKVNLDEADLMILAIAEPTKECGFRAFLKALELSELWIVETGERSSLSFPQIPNDAELFALLLGKTVDSLGKTTLEAVDKFKRDCGISGGYSKRTILSEISKLFWELTGEIGLLGDYSEDLGRQVKSEAGF